MASLAFVLGGAATVFVVLSDPRRGWGRRRDADFPAAPPQTRHESWWRTVLAAIIPSTVGLGILTACAFAFSPVLAAMLAGCLCGLGISGLAFAAEIIVTERSAGRALLREQSSGRILWGSQPVRAQESGAPRVRSS